MFPRKIIENLNKWKDSSFRKPLLLRGARQVGKTTAINLFSKEFDNYIYLNLEKEEESNLFNKNKNINDLFQAILLYKNTSSQGNRILIFLDEIQNSSEAIKSLRYFYEEKPELYIIAAGSLLETIINKDNIHFPVGRVEHMFMFPLTYEEFLIACNERKALEYFNTVPIPEWACDILFKLFHKYTLVGGMPEVIRKYSETNDITTLSSIYQSLTLSYFEDVEKYAKNEQMKKIIRHCIETAAYEAGKRIKFEGFGNSSYKSREIGESLRNLEQCMLLYLLYPATMCDIPLVPNKKKAPRLQFIDTGLLNFNAKLQQYYFEYDDLLSIYKGILAEQIVGQELLASQNSIINKPIFWVKEKKQSTAEIDFLFQYNELAIPVEVKSGPTGTLRSLHQFMDSCKHSYAIRLNHGPVKIDQVKTTKNKNFYLLNIPYFLASKLQDYIKWFISETSK